MTEEELFNRATGMPREEREAFLREACGDDHALRTSVESLLAGYEGTAFVLDTPLGESDAFSQLLDAGRDPQPVSVQHWHRVADAHEASHLRRISFGIAPPNHPRPIGAQGRRGQKSNYLAMALVEPSDEELTEFLNSNPKSYCRGAKLTFKQVDFSADKRGKALDSDVASFLETLRAAGASADISEAGDSVMLGQSFEKITEGDIAKTFGPKFAASFLVVPTGSWEGPVRSGFGLHLVFVSDRIDGSLPALAEVRDKVKRDWLVAKRAESNDALLFFNVGVEIGQVVFAAVLLALVWCGLWLWRRHGELNLRSAAARRVAVVASYLIGPSAVFWVIERMS